MRCTNCGAVLDAEQLVCPYCGTINHEASKRKQELDRMEGENRELKKEVLSKSKEEVRYKIHKRVNLVLLALFVLATVISFGVFCIMDDPVWNRNGDEEDMVRYYEEGDYENLYLCMSMADLFDSEKYSDYGHMALLWDSYMDCQSYYAMANEEYQHTGYYSAYDLEQCIDEGCDVLTGNLSYVYHTLSEENRKRMEPYQEQVYILFTGALQIPGELIEEIYEKEEYEHEEALVEYVLEVLPNE